MLTSSLASLVRAFATIAAAGLLSIPAAEAVFRLAGDEPSPDMQGLFAPFGDHTYRLGASVDTYAYFAQGRVAVSTDALGLRCDVQRRFARATGDSVDVLLMGDSQGFGNGVNYEDSIAGSFAGIEAGRGYRVANASVGGHSLAMQLNVVRWLLDTGQLKVANFVVLLTPVMIHTGNAVERANVGPDGRLYSDIPDLRTRLNLWTKTHLVVYSRVRDAVRNYGIGVQPAARSVVFDYYQAGPQADAARDALAGMVRELKALAKPLGASVQLVYMPLTVEADFEPVRGAAKAVGLELDPDVSLHVATAAADLAGVSLHSLKRVVGEVRAKGTMLNVKGDFHYSAELSRASGADLAAHIVLPPTAAGPHKIQEEKELNKQ